MQLSCFCRCRFRGKMHLPPHAYYLDRNRLCKFSLATRSSGCLAILGGSGSQTARRLVCSRQAHAWLVFLDTTDATSGSSTTSWTLLRTDQMSPSYQRGALLYWHGACIAPSSFAAFPALLVTFNYYFGRSMSILVCLSCRNGENMRVVLPQTSFLPRVQAR